MLFGIVDLGRVIWATNSLAHAARETARYAIVHGGSETTKCPVGPAAPTAVIPPPSASCPYPSPSKQSIVDTARQHAMAAGTGITVTVCYGEGCVGNADIATNARKTPVTVTITSTVTLVSGSLLGMGPYTVRGTSTMLVNN